MNNTCCVILTTTDTKKNATLIARSIIQLKLAPCIQLDTVQSFFYHKDTVKGTTEIRLMIKAPSSNYKKIEHCIRHNHNYKLPQIIMLNITNSSLDYTNWILSYQQ